MIDFKNYERVTNTDDKQDRFCFYDCCVASCDECVVEQMKDRLTKLEDLIEQGKLVEKIEPKIEMTKEQQIEKMAKVIDERLLEANLVLGSMNKGKGYWIAEDLINKGYRKKEEIEKQVAKEILENLLSFVGSNQNFWIVYEERLNLIETNGIFDLAEKIAKKYGVEVEL